MKYADLSCGTRFQNLGPSSPRIAIKSQPGARPGQHHFVHALFQPFHPWSTTVPVKSNPPAHIVYAKLNHHKVSFATCIKPFIINDSKGLGNDNLYFCIVGDYYCITGCGFDETAND